MSVVTTLPCGPQAEDYCVLVRSCFSVLWHASKDRKLISARDKLHCQMQALSFLLLLDIDSANPSKAPIYAEDAVTEFETSCKAATEDDATFLVDEMQMLLDRCLTHGQGCEKGESRQFTESSRLFVLSEMVLIIMKVLCKVGLYDRGTAFVNEFEKRARDYTDFQRTTTALGKWAVKIHSSLKSGRESGQALTECARALRSLSSDLGDQEAHSVLEGCRLVVWAVESGHNKELSGPMLLAWFSFLEEYQEQLLKTLNKASVRDCICV